MYSTLTKRIKSDDLMRLNEACSLDSVNMNLFDTQRILQIVPTRGLIQHKSLYIISLLNNNKFSTSSYELLNGLRSSFYSNFNLTLVLVYHVSTLLTEYKIVSITLTPH